MPDYRRFYPANQTVFVTIVTNRRKPWLADSTNVAALLDAMRRVKRKYPFRHLAHVILPDHFHWLFQAGGDANFSAIVAGVKRDVTWHLKRRRDGPLWQDRFFDHVIRDDADFARHADYIHYNPVKHGVASSAFEHPHSSFRAWVERGVYPPRWGAGETAPDGIEDMNLE